MRHLIPVIEAGSWAEFSAAVFFLLFLWLVFRTYRPSRRVYFQCCGELPLKDDHEQGCGG